MAGGLWPDSSESRASGSLRTSLWRLRRAGVVLVDRPARYLSLPDDVDVDVAGFESWAGRLHRAGGPDHDPLDLTRVPRGDLLPEWSETWVLAERERLHQLRLSLLDVLAGELGRRGRWGEAVAAARSAVELDPLRESSTRALIELYLQQNDVGRAVRRFQTYRRRLACDLGIEPSTDLSGLIGPELARGPRSVPHGSLPRGPGLGARRPVGRTSPRTRAGVLPP